MTYSELNGLLEANRPLISSTWMHIAFRYYGVAEIPGKNSNPQIVQFIASTIGKTFRSDGHHRSSIVEVNGKTPLAPMCFIGTRFKHIDDSNDSSWAWCSAFVNHVMISSGYPGTYSLGARSWRNWGKPMKKSEVVFGAIAVFKRTTKADPEGKTHGHVGFYLGKIGHRYLIYGGNQGKKIGGVSVTTFHENSLIGFRWPAISS